MVADLGPDVGRPLLQELAGNESTKGGYASLALWVGCMECLVMLGAGLGRHCGAYLGQ